MTYRSDVNSISTNRLIKENELLNSKYNQYKKNFSVTSKSEFFNQNPLDNVFMSTNLSSYNTPERDLDDRDKYSQLRKIYDDRVRSLYNNVKSLASKFECDEIISTMKKDPTSGEFVNMRLKEIVDENLTNEKEEIIRKLADELAELRSKLPLKDQIIGDLNQKLKSTLEESEGKSRHFENLFSETFHKNNALQTEINNLTNEMNNLQRQHESELERLKESFMLQLSKQNNDLQKYKKDSSLAIDHIQYSENKVKEVLTENEELKLELDRLTKVISVIELDNNALENKMREKQNRLEAIQSEVSNLQTANFEFNLKFKKLAEENKSLNTLLDQSEKEKKSLYEKLNLFNEELQVSENERLQSLEKKHKEKQTALKKKILELKGTINNLEEEVKNEKNNTMNTKISYNNLITRMTEDMKNIKTVWEKKCQQQESDFEAASSELENKHLMEINHLKNLNEIEIEKKIKEIQKLKSDSETLKNFEREYIKIPRHEEILEDRLNEQRRKIGNDYKAYEEEVEKEYKKRLLKIEEDKKGEFEFLTENLRKNLKSSEEKYEELRKKFNEIEAKLAREQETNFKLIEINDNLQKSLKGLNIQLEDEYENVRILKEKALQYEERLKNVSSSHYNIQGDLENFMLKVNSLEKEKENLIEEIRSKEDYYKGELSRLEKTYFEFRDSQLKKLENENELTQNLRLKLTQQEAFIEECKNENYLYDKKNTELQKQIQYLEETIETLNSKMKNSEEDNLNFERRIYELEKTNKKLTFEKVNSCDLLLTLIKSKLNSFRSEISNIKLYAANEINNIKKESFKMVENIMSKIKMFKISNDKSVEFAVKDHKEQLEREFIRKCEEKEKALSDEVAKIQSKYEKHLLEQFKLNEKLEKDNKHISDQNQSSVLKTRELQFRVQELEQENKKLGNTVNSLRNEIDNYNDMIHKLRQDKNAVLKLKSETEELDDMSKKELAKKFQTSLANILGLVNKTKKKYSQEIFQFKLEVDKLSNIIESK